MKAQVDLTVGYDRSSSESKKFASNVAKDITQKAAKKVTQKVEQTITTKISENFTTYGLEVVQFFIENVSFPPEVEAALDKRSSMGVIGNMQTYRDYQVASSIPVPSANPNVVPVVPALPRVGDTPLGEHTIADIASRAAARAIVLFIAPPSRLRRRSGSRLRPHAAGSAALALPSLPART